MFGLLLAWLSLNLDNSNLGQTLTYDELSVEGVRAYFHNMSRGGETHFFICPNAQNTSYDSKVWDPVWHVDPRTKDTSKSVAWARNYRILHERGVDWVQVMVDACRERKVSPWMSMRMNDIHNIGDYVSWASSTFWLDHPEFRRVPNKLKGGSFDADLALDYTHREVREYALSLVREMLERWDVDGIECDWLRFVHHVNAEAERTRAGCVALTEFMREVRRIADEVGVRRGRHIGVSVRVATMPEAAYGLGCDAVDWAAKGYVDVVMPCNFFSTSDFAADWAWWKKRLHEVNPKVKLVGGVDFMGVNREGLGPKGFTDGELSGYLERMVAAGISDVGFFNLFRYQATETRKYIQVDGMPNLADWVRMRGRTYPVTYHDAVPEGFASGQVLPAKLDVRREFPISIGKVGRAGGVSVVLALDQDVPAGTSELGLDVLLNGVKATGVSSVPVATWMPGAKTTKTVLKLVFPLSAVKDGENVVIVGALQTPLKLRYVALHMDKDLPSESGMERADGPRE